MRFMAVSTCQQGAIAAMVLAAPFATGFMKRRATLMFGLACSVLLVVPIVLQCWLVGVRWHEAATAACALAFGAGTGGCYVLWVMVFASFGRRAAIKVVGLASAAFPLVYLCFALLLPKEALPFVALGLALTSSGILIARVRSLNYGKGLFRRAPHGLRRNAALVDAGFAKAVTCVALLGIASVLARHVAIGEAALAEWVVTVSVAGAMAVAVLFLAVDAASKSQKSYYERIPQVYQVLYLLVAAGFVLLPFLGLRYRLVLAGLTYSVFTLASLLMMVASIEAAMKLKMHPMFAYCVFAGVVYSATCLGAAFGSAVKLLDGSGPALSFAALAVLYVLSLALVFPRKEGRPAVADADEVSDALREKCRLAAETSGLSSREAEVMELLARGRDLPYIAELLCISKSTVQSHGKRIYRKMGVHSKQELITKIEGMASCDQFNQICERRQNGPTRQVKTVQLAKCVATALVIAWKDGVIVVLLATCAPSFAAGRRGAFRGCALAD